ncbi:TetR/AcrR family transcriptional regulator [Cryptosporangium arvum]|uniref:TetR/AcrR family transcriptional regulator n=1 Tax=Cryptosporangium arvum TaxID=80871 RepID=UPI0004B6C93F|nr:TetR/AcrR family transcriptional regulator [Cryptosporangium arvum]
MAAAAKKPLPGRRAEYAAATRLAIEEAARDLFVENGFEKTTVDAIARRARVAPATVYAVTGGKQGLLKTLIESRITAPDVAEDYARIESQPDADSLLRFVVRVTRERFERSSPLMRVIIATAPHHANAAEALAMAHASLRGALELAARRLADLGALRPGIDVDEATGRLWFHVCNASYFTLVDDNGWPLDKAERYLHESLRAALLTR